MATINQITVNSTTYDLAVSAANVSGTVANATTATKLGTATKGSATQPIYLSSGAPTACTYSLAKSVPADAKFTDTTYSTFVKSGSSAAAGLVPKPSTTAGTTKYLREDGTWQVPPDTNTTYSAMTGATSSAAGTIGLVPAPAAGDNAKYLKGDGTWGTPSTSYTLPTASSSTLGGVKVGTGLGISSGTLSVSYGTTATTACNGNDSRLSDSRTPKAHAATATTYGAGTASNYGHVKLSDSYTTSGGTAAYGVAASSYALVTAYNTLNSNLTWKKLTFKSFDNVTTYNNMYAYYWTDGLQLHIKFTGVIVTSKICDINTILFKVNMPVTVATEAGGFMYNASLNSILPVVLYPDGHVSIYDTDDVPASHWISMMFCYFVLPIK